MHQIDKSLIYLNETRRIITGGDILGRLLRGLVQNPVLDQGLTGNSKRTCTK